MTPRGLDRFRDHFRAHQDSYILTEQEPRVQEAAQAAWTDWVEQQRIHMENLMAGVR
jgi:hypothetical protein